MAQMKNKAIVANIGHFDNEIDMAGLARVPGVTEDRDQAAGPRVDLRHGQLDHRALRGSPDEPRQRHRPPELRHEQLLRNQTIAQIELFTKTDDYDKQVYTLPKHLDEKVARLHLDALGVRLTELTKGQAEYLGVDVAGPYKPEHYRY